MLSWFIQWAKRLFCLVCLSPIFVSLSLHLAIKCSICYVKFLQRYESCCVCWERWVNVRVLGYLDHVKYECVKTGFFFVACYCLPERLLFTWKELNFFCVGNQLGWEPCGLKHTQLKWLRWPYFQDICLHHKNIATSGVLVLLDVTNFRRTERCYKGWTQ